MQNHHLTEFTVRLVSPQSDSYRCQRAANALDIDVAKKAVHELTVRADVTTPYRLGVIVGASGSGKSTLAQRMFGSDCMRSWLDLQRPVIDQFRDEWDYDACAAALTSVGLTSVPCWIRIAATLSNGQRARAEAALALAHGTGTPDAPVVIDEWTSVVDRTVARVMSACVAKHARRSAGAPLVLCCCHRDVIDWLNPDWILDCDTATYLDRRLLQRDFQRSEHLTFTVRECSRATWRRFSKYHYLSERLPAGHIVTFGLFHGDTQVGFQCFANYVPDNRSNALVVGTRRVMHSNRTVVHPDYAGLGLGIQLIDATSTLMHARGFRVMAKFSSEPIYRAMSKDPRWSLLAEDRYIGSRRPSGNQQRGVAGSRQNVRTFTFEWVGAPPA